MSVTSLIAKKIGMTRVADDEGQMHAVTVLQVPTQKVTKILTPERDGYHGVQVGYYEKREKLLNKPDIHRLRKAGVAENFTRFREYRLDDVEGLEIGNAFTASLFADVGAVDVTGITKGRGFIGATKRWGAKTGRRTHGSRFHRRPGSLGQRTTPGRVFKNKHMPGHMGNKQRTIQNIEILGVDPDNDIITVRGSVPGHREGFLLIRPSMKAKEAK